MTDLAVTSVAGTTTGSSTDEASASLVENYEMFLTLLTEQLKHQDPLDPLDSNEFVSQLVEFSSVEQLIEQTASLEDLVAIQAGDSASAAVDYLGQIATLDDPRAPLTGGSAEWLLNASAPVDGASVAIEDASGRVVFETTLDLEAGEQSFEWDGLDANGNALPDGAYTLSIGAQDIDGEPVGVDVGGIGLVTGVDLSADQPSLIMGGLTVPVSSARSITAPPPPPAPAA